MKTKMDIQNSTYSNLLAGFHVCQALLKAVLEICLSHSLSLTSSDLFTRKIFQVHQKHWNFLLRRGNRIFQRQFQTGTRFTKRLVRQKLDIYGLAQIASLTLPTEMISPFKLIKICLGKVTI